MEACLRSQVSWRFMNDFHQAKKRKNIEEIEKTQKFSKKTLEFYTTVYVRVCVCVCVCVCFV